MKEKKGIMFFNPPKEAPKNLLLIEVDKEIAILRENLEQARLKIMSIIVSIAEQEARYQNIGETIGRQRIFLETYIEAKNRQNDENIDFDDLKAQYEQEYKKLCQDIILNKKDYLKSRDHIFDKENQQMIKLDAQNHQTILANFKFQLEMDLGQYQIKFIDKVASCHSIIDLRNYLNELETFAKELNESISKLIEQKSPHGMTYNQYENEYVRERRQVLGKALLESVKQDDKALCLILLEEYRADIDFQDEKGFSMLHLAKTPETASLLLEKGANTKLVLNYKKPHDHRGFTPLHYQVLEEREDIVKLLLEAGAEVDAKSAKSVTPLFLAAKTRPNKVLVTLLMSYGANPRLRNNKGYFAMGPYATHKGDKFEEMALLVEQLLIQQAADGAKAQKKVEKLEKQIEKMQQKLARFSNIIEELVEQNNKLKKDPFKKQEKQHNISIIKVGDMEHNEEASGTDKNIFSRGSF